MQRAPASRAPGASDTQYLLAVSAALLALELKPPEPKRAADGDALGTRAVPIPPRAWSRFCCDA
jgi:hypothetical protein